MTNDAKLSLIKHLTGNLTEETPTTTPYYKSFDYTTIENSDSNGGNIALKCKDGNGNYNGKTLLYSPTLAYNNVAITIVDENLNILHVYYSYNTGTPFNVFMGLGISEDGNVYGVDYDSSTQKYRFILMNNLSEPTKMPDGSLEYRAVLRNDWFIQGYTSEDDISPYKPVILQKSNSMAKYYMAFTDSLGQTLMPSTFEINVGEGNTWTRLQDITLLSNTLLTQYIYFNSEDTPIANYYSLEFVYSGGVESDEKIVSVSVSGDGSPTYTDYIASTKNLYDSTGYTYYDVKMVAKSDTWCFLILSGISSGGAYKQRVRVWEIKNGVSTQLFTDTSTTTITGNYKQPFISYDESEGIVYLYYGFQKDSTQLSNDKLYFVATSKEILDKGIDFTVDTNQEIFSGMSAALVLNSLYYVKKSSILITDANDPTTLNVFTTTLMVGSGVDTQPYGSVDDIDPTKGVLFDSNNKLLFARGLYNKKVNKNKTVSILNVPNKYLNNILIDTGDLLGGTNLSIEESPINITKNMYENLFINYFNTLNMENRNNINNIIDNPSGASRINLCVAKDLDYDNAKADKIRINYNDGSTNIQGVSSTITNGVATYDFILYVPEDKYVDSVDIISDDENTIYQTITFGGILENTKYYQITQDVYVS